MKSNSKPVRIKGTEKRTISGSPELFAKADDKMNRLSIGNFSEYVRQLIIRDVDQSKQAA